MPPIRFKTSSGRERHQKPDDPMPPPEDRTHSAAPHHDSQGFDHNAFFREALFESLQDAEAAQRWEYIYGQPLHVYPRPESMDDDMYIEYVKGMMWQNTQEYSSEQRAKKQQERSWREEREKLRAADRAYRTRRAMRMNSRVDESLYNSPEDAWDRYQRAWGAAVDSSGDENAQLAIPWPVMSGRYADVSQKHVEEFFYTATPSTTLVATLKVERVRWHPDKMQQKLGKLDAETLQTVTAVFQEIDRLYSTLRT